MPYALARATSLFLTLFLIQIFSVKDFWWLFFYLLFAHYFLAFFYAKERVLAGIKTITGNLVLGSTLAAGLVMEKLQLPPLAFYFSFHCAFSDAYLIPRSSRLHFFARLFFNLFAYFALLKPLPTFNWQYQTFFWWGALAFYGLFIFLHATSRKSFSKKHWWDVLVFESLLLFFLFYFKNSLIEFHQLVFYHLVLWIIIPHLKSGVPLLKVTLEHALACFAFVFIFYPLSFNQVFSLSYFWGYLHVTSTFILSSFNPSFLQFNFRKPLYSS